jgi:hypothetical protein
MGQGRFIGYVDVRWIKADTFQLLQHFYYECRDGRLCHAPRGMVFDFASIPRPLKPFVSPTGVLGKAATIHDALYAYKQIRDADGKTVRKIEFQREADDIFLEAMEESGVGWTLRHFAYTAVCVGGYGPWISPEPPAPPLDTDDEAEDLDDVIPPGEA